MIRTPALPATDLTWLATLAAAAVLGSMALACMTPFTALAVVAAFTLPRGAGIVTVLGAWGVNQVIGYGMLGYPTDPATIGRGVTLAVAALAAFAVGRMARSPDGAIVGTRAIIGFLAAFAAYEAVNFAGALLLGGTENFTAAIVWMIGSNDALWFGGLLALAILLRGFAPARFGRLPTLRLA